MGDINIGRKVYEYRKAKKLTIRDLAKLTGLSISLLSQIERGIANPTLNALESIASAMGISLFLLFMEDVCNKSLILRKEDRKRIIDRNTEKILYDILPFNSLNSNVELNFMYLPPFTEANLKFIECEVEEIVFVIKNQIYLVFDSEEFIMREGDTVRILPNRKHKFKNTQEKEAEILFIKIK